MHKEAHEYILSIKENNPKSFENVSVLDVGSLDINGNNRRYFNDYTYTGLDIGHGKNVDIVCPIHLLETFEQYDTIISTEMLEHDCYWKESLLRIIDLIKDDGSIVITCAGINRAEHGTTRTSPVDSPFTNEYYLNISKGMLLSVFKGKFEVLEITEGYNNEDIYLFAKGKNFESAE